MTTLSLGAVRRYALAIAGILLLGGCAETIDRISAVGRDPQLTPITNPLQSPGYRPISLPMPIPEPENHKANSLWRTGAKGFFRDQRASKVGDILTVVININDTAVVNNQTSRSRDSAEDASVGNMFGLEEKLADIMPGSFDANNIINLNSGSTSDSVGALSRDETIALQVAAIVTQVLPNGNLVIHGTQEVRVNFEVRQLSINGVVRHEDISATNTVTHEQIAEARILYGGRGTISDIQRPRYGQEVIDIIYPF
jgi:flagellar L-ring protein precursor FlgH